MLKNIAIFGLFSMIFIASAVAETFRVADGDSLEIGNRRIRLDGIDAPEFMQVCINSRGEEYFCGQQSWEFLRETIGDKIPNCVCLAEPDKYNREICECYVGEICLNEYMVLNGWAESYHSEKYAKAEEEAKQKKRGIWQGKHMRPALYRILNRYERQKN
ncbi:MAG: thermonuclease family protein [Alphaproteobacteria bacterium]|nr:thermonuclease family protein [Alphaproteobacteria bacterium]